MPQSMTAKHADAVKVIEEGIAMLPDVDAVATVGEVLVFLRARMGFSGHTDATTQVATREAFEVLCEGFGVDGFSPAKLALAAGQSGPLTWAWIKKSWLRGDLQKISVGHYRWVKP